MTSTNASDHFVCPVCGEDVPAGALSCPGCGADETTGWNTEATRGDGLDLPDADFDYDQFVDAEFGKQMKPRSLKWVWWITGIVTSAGILWLLWRGVWG